MANLDEELESLFGDSSFDDEEMDDFLKMLETENSDELSEVPVETADEDDSSFTAEDLSDDDLMGSLDILEALDSAGEVDTTAAEEEEDFGVAEELFSDLDGILSGVSEEEETAVDDEVVTVPKKSLWKRIVSRFKPELTEEQKIARQMEEEESRVYEEQLEAERQEKKQAKAEAKLAAKAEAQAKAEARKAAKDASKAAKQAVSEKKKKEKEEKRKEKQGNVPASHLIPLFPLISCIVIGIAIATVFILGSQTFFYSSSIKSAKEFFIHQKYDKAYEKVIGLDVKEKDKEFCDQVYIVNEVDNELKNYNSYIEVNRYEDALDSLLGGVRKYNEYVDDAEELGLFAEFRSIFDEMVRILNEKFGVDIAKANQMLDMTETQYHNEILALSRQAAINDGVIEDVIEYEDQTNQE